MDNGEDWQKPNVFGRVALESLGELVPRLRERSWNGLVLTGKPFVFAAGADLTEFPKLSTPELARAAAKAGHDAFAAIRDLPFPTLAAINGAALGGGLEIALHCDFRTLARSVRHIGFPEVFLGIVPGWGGTQLAPRVVGAAAAVELIVANPLKQNRLLRRRPGGRAWARRRAARRRRVPRRLDRVARARDRGRSRCRARRRPLRCRRGLREGAVRRRRRGARRRARALPGARSDRRQRRLDASRRATPPRRRRSAIFCRGRRRRPGSTPSTSSSGRSRRGSGFPTRNRGGSRRWASSEPA